MAVNERDIVDTRKRFVSPKGVLEPYAYLNKPDYGRDHFVNERGQYKASITYDLNDPKVQQFIKFIDDVYQRNWELRLADHEENPPTVPRGKKPLEPYKGVLPYVENDDGTVTFNFGAWASYLKDGEKKAINLTFADAKGKPVRGADVPNIWSGSELRVSFKVLPYGWSKIAGASVKLQLQGVMLIDVKTSSDGADEFAEYAEEEGFEAGDYAPAAKSSSPDYGDDADAAPWENDGHEEDSMGVQGSGDY